MRFLQLTLLFSMMSVFFSDPAFLHAPFPPEILRSMPGDLGTNPISTNDVEPETTNIIFQSKDGGQTWDDISQGLPESEEPEDFFAGESDVYLRIKNVMYRSKSNLETPVWEKENVPASRSASIAFNRSGVIAYNYEGQIYQRVPAAGTWLPIYTNFERQSVETIFETSDGVIFVGCQNGLYKSTDKGESWRQVQNDGWVANIVESEGVLMATGQKGIMRSADNGEHWQWVISEGGVGIDVEKIDGGFAAISYSTSTLTRRLRISRDNGKTWEAIDEALRPSLSISSIKQMGKYLLCGHPDGIFRSSDMGKTWNIVHSITEKKVVKYGNTWNVVDSSVDNKVFKIYVSGNVLYAMAKDTGC
jgi:photosystem II stability/assembly factor-like uncharacterized protein